DAMLDPEYPFPQPSVTQALRVEKRRGRPPLFRPKPTPRPRKPLLDPLKILAWADAHHRHTGRWPNLNSGPVIGAPGRSGVAGDRVLGAGARPRAGGSSLGRLLEAERCVRNVGDLRPLTEAQILAWADAHYQRTGRWPRRTDGPIPDAPGETWK